LGSVNVDLAHMVCVFFGGTVSLVTDWWLTLKGVLKKPVPMVVQDPDPLKADCDPAHNG